MVLLNHASPVVSTPLLPLPSLSPLRATHSIPHRIYCSLCPLGPRSMERESWKRNKGFRIDRVEFEPDRDVPPRRLLKLGELPSSRAPAARYTD